MQQLQSFIRRASSIMSNDERSELINTVAAKPEAGVSLGGGLYKMRIARPGAGRSGGYRTVYVFGGRAMPIILLTVFAKNEKANLSRAELAEAVTLSKILIRHYGGHDD